MLCCRIVNGIKNKNIKNSLGATWNASHSDLFLFAFSDNLISEDWFFAEGERFLSFWRCHRPRKRAALVMWCGWFKPRLEIRHATALTTGAKHWRRQKAVFYVFVSVPQYFSTEPFKCQAAPCIILWSSQHWSPINTPFFVSKQAESWNITHIPQFY